MNEPDKRLTKEEIIGQKIAAIYLEDRERVFPKFQSRRVIIRLKNGICFDFENFYTIDIDQVLVVRPCDCPRWKFPDLRVRSKSDLDSPIVAFVTATFFAIDVGILLANGFLISID